MNLAGRQVLVIDDVRDIREVLAVLLRMEGADVAEAASGEEAMQHLRQRQFDVVLLDLALPDMPGELLIRQIVGSSAGRSHVVVITGCGEPEVTRARAAGADAVFTKPVEWSEILEFLRTPASASPAA